MAQEMVLDWRRREGRGARSRVGSQQLALTGLCTVAGAKCPRGVALAPPPSSLPWAPRSLPPRSLPWTPPPCLASLLG